MPALVDLRPCQNAPANQMRRLVPVVPVIPRRLEKRNAGQNIGGRSVGSASVESLRKRGSSVAKDSSVEPDNENSERKSTFTAEKDEDFSMEKHASTPPPLSDSPTYNVVASPASQYDAPYLVQNSLSSDVQTDSTQPATFHSNPTPPSDSVRSPNDSSYQGYGHIPYKDFQPQPTPPPSTYTLYQGYSYGDGQLIFPPHAGSPPYQRSSTQSEHDVNLPAGSESELPPSDFYQTGSGPSSIPSSQEALKSKSEQKVTVAEISSVGQAPDDEFYRSYSTCQDLHFHHQLFSQGIQGSDDEMSPVEPAEAGLVDFLTRGAQFEIWRHTVLDTLDQAPQNATGTYWLTDYLAREFNTIEHADCRLRVFHETRMCDIADFLLHSLLIDQSPLLRGLRKSTTTQENGIRLLRVWTSNRFITPLAIETALQFCYGRSIMEYKGLPNEIGSSKSSVEVSTSWMDNGLALAASGYLFQLETVISRGFQIASSVLNWENIEKALLFAMDGGSDSEWNPQSLFRSSIGASPVQIHDNTLGVTPGSSEPVAVGSNMQYQEPSSISLHAAYSRSANDLLLQCLDFILLNFPVSWKLDVLARPLADIDRLPTTAGSRSPLATSKLSQIQFGDHPSEQAKSRDVNIMLSSLLLSLPFPLLKYILDRLDETNRSRNINQIIDERERRRRQAVKCESIFLSQSQEGDDDWNRAGWKETVGLENSRFCLKRKWIGFRAPLGAQA